jgi:predicted ribosome quality control (RQC) complex YloA/Tae2 family protein
MSFDGNLISKLTDELKIELTTGRISKIYQLSKYDLLLMIATSSGKKQLLISSSPNYARIYLTEMKYEKPTTPPTFCMFLRKHLEGGIIFDIKQVKNDRIIEIQITKRNEIGDIENKRLIIEAMGRYSNIIITTDEYKILESIKHQMPFDGNERTIYPGAHYEYPYNNQINPKNDIDLNLFFSNPENIDYDVLKQNLMGFSPVAITEIFHRFENSKDSIKTIIKEFLDENNPTIINNNKDTFYFTDLTHIKGDRQYYQNVNKLLDYYFFNRDRVDIIKQYSKNLINFSKSYRKKLLNKIEKLSRDLDATSKMDEFRIKGELIQANIHNIEKGLSSFQCQNYYTDQFIDISLDNRLTPVQNAEKYFKKYKKIKASIPHLKDQIKDARNELKYIDQISVQIENASLKDIEEIKIELMNRKLIKRTNIINKKNKKPNYDIYTDALGVEILVGKNNIQNSYITHKLAKHTDVWFHVKDGAGSHVVSRQSLPLEEETIRTCAQLAAYYSNFKNSNSVPIDYTEIRNIKKVPGKINSFVTYRNHKTIYIDPDEKFIQSLNKK